MAPVCAQVMMTFREALIVEVPGKETAICLLRADSKVQNCQPNASSVHCARMRAASRGNDDGNGRASKCRSLRVALRSGGSSSPACQSKARQLSTGRDCLSGDETPR